jgi:hypothetical protein
MVEPITNNYDFMRDPPRQLDPGMVQARKELLRLQVRDFAEWLKAQGILP